MSDWNPELYLKFKKERTQPSLDLAARLDGSPAKVLDVGCGPGNSTQVVADRFPGAKVIGIDFPPIWWRLPGKSTRLWNLCNAT